MRSVHRSAIYISLVEHPARMECGVELAAAEFPPELSPSKYHAGDLDGRGSIVFVCSVVRRGNVLVGLAGVLLGSVIPFTLIVILPTNKQLLSPTLDRRSAQTGQLLARWGTLHSVRSVLSGMALPLFLYLVIFRKPF